jgi:hypothetical protein
MYFFQCKTSSVDKQDWNYHHGHLLNSGIFIEVLHSSREKLCSVKNNHTILRHSLFSNKKILQRKHVEICLLLNMLNTIDSRLLINWHHLADVVTLNASNDDIIVLFASDCCGYLIIEATVKSRNSKSSYQISQDACVSSMTIDFGRCSFWWRHCTLCVLCS